MMVHVEQQSLAAIDKSQLVEKAKQMSKEGWRLVQISCTAKDAYEVTYTFDKDYACSHLRVTLPKDNLDLPSITGAYFAAFTYENELHDLFGINVQGNALDFKGKFYKLSVKTPFAPQPQQPAQ
ncbi:MAG TPA: NADH-quinone oxidoreductase subunit C [Chitinivibrionales bacterium]|nr:NADH-quinone oxidoreductase subunit C [Chitinivibrionales bacterium]